MMAKAHLDVHIAKMKMCPFDDFKLVSYFSFQKEQSQCRN